MSFGGNVEQQQPSGHQNVIQSEQDTATLGVSQDIRLQPKLEQANSSLFHLQPE
jgi:hypothetical protein